MSNIEEKIFDHYKKFLGDYVGADKYQDDEHQIQILGYDKAIADCLVFASFGLSKYSDELNNCCEVILATNKDYDRCVKAFANALFYAISQKMNFGRGVMISGIDNVVKDFSSLHNKTAIYFTEVYALPEDFSLIENECKIYMGFFISEEESEYIKQFGCEKFEDFLEQNDVDVIDLDRASVI